jgi:hypothetical protein
MDSEKLVFRIVLVNARTLVSAALSGRSSTTCGFEN